MSLEEVKSLMNENEVYEDWMGGNLNFALSYPGLILSFSDCDPSGPLPNSTFNGFRLYKRKDLEFFGQPFESWTITTFEKELNNKSINYTKEKYEDIYEIAIPSISLLLNFESNKLTYAEDL